MKQTRLLFISGGHSNTPGRDQGAAGLTETEGIITARIRMKLAYYLRNKGIVVYIDGDDTVTKQSVAYLRNLRLPQNAVALDIHCNSYVNDKARGVEAVIPELYTEFEHRLAGALIHAVNKATTIPIRRVITEGSSARKKLLWMTVPVENILLELGFISNSIDNMLLSKHEDVMVQELGNVLFNFITE